MEKDTHSLITNVVDSFIRRNQRPLFREACSVYFLK